ncbi:hypothetical protein AKJ51_01580 [candidate division MSBL1 archaeon SCGC-AAA382A20]|uniref:Uncharacterized protein n=1 Tax=candidate division MSBL1 archaeon SCGC-AAA382A20 TaxID=1698280 RepID=A0A133VLM1_9EURY|nr:hypothetical protein AKJ51_01580 [candidate division MSBL1 archaeon SCGC-AAA382A20]
MNIKKAYPILIMGLFLFLATYGQTVKADDTLSKSEIIYEGDEYYKNPDVNNVMDLSSPNPNKINFMQWKEDFEYTKRDVPKGVYVGQSLSPSILELDYEPLRLNEKQMVGNAVESRGTYGISIVSKKVRFSTSDIMNGASEFWVKLPCHPQQLEPITFAEIGEYTDVYSKVHSGLYIYEGSYDDFTIEGDYTAGIFDLRAKGGIKSEANAIISSEDGYNNSAYQKVNFIINSDVTYTFVLLLLTTEKPYLKLDETSMGGKVSYKNLKLNDVGYNLSWESLVWDYTNLYADFEEVDEGNKTLPLTPHFSFIFTKGVGYNNLFGHTIETTSKISMSKEYELNTAVGNKKYPSVYTPFIYNDDMTPYVRPDINLTISYPDGETILIEDHGQPLPTVKGMDALWYAWNETDYNYKFYKYLLWSGTYIKNNFVGDDVYVTTEYDSMPKGTTFLCKKPTTDTYSKNPPGMGIKSGKSFWLGTRWYMEEEGENIGEKKNDTYWFNYTNMAERYFYDIHSSFDLTDGRWNTIKLPSKTISLNYKEIERRGLSDGLVVRGRHRNFVVKQKPYEKYVIDGTLIIMHGERYEVPPGGEITLENPGQVIPEDVDVYNENGTLVSKAFTTKINTKANPKKKEVSGFSVDYNPWAQPIRFVKDLSNHYLNKFIGFLKTIPSTLSQKFNSLKAFISSLPDKIWAQMQKVGKWIKRTVMEFLEPVLEVLGNIWELGGLYLEALSYVLSFIAFFIGMAVIVKAISYTELNKILNIGRGSP